MPMPSSPLARLGAFRTELHACCTRRGDALCELGDALLSADSFLSLPHLNAMKRGLLGGNLRIVTSGAPRGGPLPCCTQGWIDRATGWTCT
jgi:hypothetical protein